MCDPRFGCIYNNRILYAADKMLRQLRLPDLSDDLAVPGGKQTLMREVAKEVGVSVGA